VTENKVDIIWVGSLFVWYDQEPVPLREQPPLHTTVAVETVTSYQPENVKHLHDPYSEQEICPKCGRKMPKPKIENPEEPKKLRATWAIAVPLEERENGADVLDELLEGARDKLDNVGISYSDSSKAKFHVLAASLGLFVQHFDSITGDA
jgi:hypothetical protein